MPRHCLCAHPAHNSAEGVHISLACSPSGGDNSLFCAASGLNCPAGSLAPGQTNLSGPLVGTSTLRTSKSIFILRCEQIAHEQLPPLSVLVLNINDAPSLLRNDGGNKNNWIKIKLLGTKCNRTAIGARVRVVTGKHTQIDEVHSG
jgi:hypothetical protein